MKEPDDFLPLAARPFEVAKMLGISKKTLARWTSDGVIPHFKIGEGKRKLVLYPLVELRDWISQQTSRPEENHS